MTTDVLQDIISRCHQRCENPLKQRQTISTPPLYKGLPYHFTVYCAHGYPVLLQDLEAAGISFTPIGQCPGTDRPPRYFRGERFLKRQEVTDWEVSRWHKSYGIHVYTGMPSARDDAPWHDIDFTYQAICAAPEAILACVQALVDAVTNPLLTLSKSGGLRFSCRIPGYLHPHTEQPLLSVNKQTSTAENPHQHKAYIEILGEMGHNCWDARYEILLGNLLDPPVIPKEIFFAAIDALRAALHDPAPQSIQHKESLLDAPYSLGSGKLDLAREAFFRRGFAYVRQADGFHYWRRHDDETDNTEVSLWESEGGVWVCASTSDTGLPMEATLITDVWNDTSILPPTPATGLPIDDKVIAIREGKLSPLAIKRSKPILHKAEPTENTYETHEDISVQVQRAFDRNVRVLGFTAEIDAEKNPEVESILRTRKAICLKVPSVDLAAVASHFIQSRDVRSVAQWRDRMHLWDQVKDTPSTRLFSDPEYAKIAEQLLETREGTQHLCIINTPGEDQLFLRCKLPRTTLKAWVANWQGNALGNFSIALLNVVDIRDKSHGNAIKRLRTVVQTFEWLEEEIIQQMCHVDVATVENIQAFPAVYADPSWTFWHQLKRFFAHYTRDADAPMRWEDETLQFRVPPMLHPSVQYLFVNIPTLYAEHLRQTFLDVETETLRTQPTVWVPGNRVFQIRTGIYPQETILDFSNTWDIMAMSETGQHIFSRIQAEIERDRNIKHGIITYFYALEQLEDIAKNENVCFLTSFRDFEEEKNLEIALQEGLEIALQEAQVIWMVGMPEMGVRRILNRTQILFGNHAEPLSYEMEPESYRYKDERVQSVYEKEVTRIFTQIIKLAQLDRLANKKVMLITGSRIPEITDRPETLLFDWEDFDVAGGLDKLAEVIATREQFETERDNLTSESSRKEVERVLGCSTRQANRVLQRMRGGRVRVTFREQILVLLADGDKKTPELTAAIQGHPKAINTELTRLVDRGEIVKVRRGVYRLPEPENK
ncbi:MAG: type IV toxin-antitoxin system AbiEi family antitoxin domain-containing protein [Candidatus Poribacteria bacterium]|nr:type IV toxin-antitoxin system AbiEi family antitoxin domain-containing protein [Candidatus Poribacteria bacterium]